MKKLIKSFLVLLSLFSILVNVNTLTVEATETAAPMSQVSIYAEETRTFSASSLPTRIWVTRSVGIARYAGYISRISYTYNYGSDTATAVFGGYISRTNAIPTIIKENE